MNEPRNTERPRTWASRFKSGLETPLAVHYSRETKIVVSPPRWYDALVACCFGLGLLAFVTALSGVGSAVLLDPVWRLWTGVALVFAGSWAALSNERLVCDTATKSYVRWEGKGPFKTLTKGVFAEFDALVLLAESTFGAMGQQVDYRLVLHWKASKLPLLIVSQQSHPLPTGGGLNYAAGHMLQDGQRLSKALGIPLYDNSYFHSPEPLRPV